MTRSGAAASVLPKCKFFEQLQFLVEKTENRPSDSNVSVFSELPQPKDNKATVIELDSSLTREETGEPKTKKNKRKDYKQDPVDIALLNQLGNINDAMSKCDDMDDEETLYCKSLIPILKGLPMKKKRLAQLKIRELLFEMEFNE